MTESLPNSPPTRFSFRQILQRFAADILYLPRWQQLFLSIALLAGAAGWLGNFLHPSAPVESAAATTAASPTNPPATPTPWISRAGISLVIGFLIGWLFRTFTKIMAAIALLFASLLGTLSYFHILNADTTNAANQEYHHASAWMIDQAARLKTATMAHIPSTTSASLGLFMGVRKKKRTQP